MPFAEMEKTVGEERIKKSKHHMLSLSCVLNQESHWLGIWVSESEVQKNRSRLRYKLFQDNQLNFLDRNYYISLISYEGSKMYHINRKLEYR